MTNLQNRQRGSVAALVLHVVLLALVLGQVVFLSSRYRWRLDSTADGYYTLTRSTRDLIESMPDRLVLEAYFSPKEDLPGQWRDGRDILDNFLDELVQVGRGKIVLERFNPNDDKAIADKCTRLGIKPIDLRSGTATSMEVNRNWQGMRLVHGGSKQKVLEQVQPMSAFQLEAVITPAIKEVLTKDKRVVGYMEWPAAAVGGQQGGSHGWTQIRAIDLVAKRYDFRNVKDAAGALVPEDVDTVLLFRPKDLTDREKYVIDQFLMRGGNLVVFAEAAEYQVGPYRSFNRQPVELDAGGSAHKFVEQLAHYGIELRQKVVADAHPQARTGSHPLEYLAAMWPNMFGQVQPTPVLYPYFFHAVAAEWSQLADQVATDQRTGQRDVALADEYRRKWRPGIDSKEFLFAPFAKVGRGPGFYWPCWVDVRRSGGEPSLPEGVTGSVMLWSSPLALVEEPQQNLNPIGGSDIQQQRASMMQFLTKLDERMRSEPRQQAPLMAEVSGSFRSFFEGKERPKKQSELDAEKAAADAEAKKEGEQPPLEAGQEGPPAPKPEDAGAKDQPAEPALLPAATKAGRVIVVGDSDFLRDDFVRGEYQQAGGPVSVFTAPSFFQGLLDWLAQDRDLVELQSRVPVDRSLRFVDAPTTMGDPIESERAVERKVAALQWFNVLLPVALFGALGLFVWLGRRAQKKSFLATAGN
ncbi:MAG: hypothetical protein RL148_2710 [Planctomycetota bacterium]